MKNAIRSIALVAAAAMSLPVLAAEPSAIAGDPTWPAIEKPAPALVVNAPPAVQAPVDITQVEVQGANPALALSSSGQAESAVAADPTWPAASRTAPAIALGAAAPAHVASK